MKRNLIIASGNAHKVEEFGVLLEGLNLDVQSAAVCGGMPDVVEDGDTFLANSHLKASALRKVADAEAWVLADDSGLEVDALEGAPGVYSARYAGAHATDAENVEKLLKALEGVEMEARAARFVCLLTLIDHEGFITHYEGFCRGHISLSPAGTSGFGYDPVFIPDGYEQSFAELGEATKSALSHRAGAIAAMKRVIASEL